MILPALRASKLLTLDFETYYAPDYTLSKLTTEAYVRDPRFETVLVGLKVDQNRAEWMTPERFAALAATLAWDEIALLAHHAHFDGLIASHHYKIAPGFWFDTLSMARALHGSNVGNSLKKLAEHYGIGAKGEEVLHALGKRRADFSPEEYTRYGVYCANDCELEYRLLHILGEGFPDLEFWNIDTTIRMFTEPALRVDAPMLAKFVADERIRKQALLDRISKTPDLLQSNDKFAGLLVEFGVEPPRKVSPRTGKETWAFAKTDPGMQDLLEHEREEVRWLAEARVGIKSTISQTRAERLLTCESRGSWPVYLKYHGAHTGRWSGGDKTNPQNFTRGGTLRDAVLAPDGHEIVVVDSGQIEARITAWLAGQERLLAAFASGEDVYATEGSKFFGRPISKADTPNERQVSKCMVLGMGYGMGWYKFAGEMLKGMMGAPPMQFRERDAEALEVDVRLFALDERRRERVETMPSRLPFEARLVHCAVADGLVNRYRRANDQIVDLWRRMGLVLEAMDLGAGMQIGPVRVVRHGLLMPDGLVMRYPGLRRDEEGWGFMGGRAGKERVRIYGGLLVENIVQRLARTVVAEQMQVIRAHGYPIKMMSHDEVVFLAPEGRGAGALETAIQIMKTPPAWAPGLPLAAEGGVGKRYGDAK